MVKVGPNTKNVVIWGTVVLSFVLALTQRLSVGAVAEDLVREFGYSGSQLGLITSAAMYAYAIMQVPAGFMVDSLERLWVWADNDCVGISAVCDISKYRPCDSFQGFDRSGHFGNDVVSVQAAD